MRNSLPLNQVTWCSLKSLTHTNNSYLFLLSQISLSPCFNIHYSLNTIIPTHTFWPKAMDIQLGGIHIFLSFLTGSVPPVNYFPEASFTFQFCFSLRLLFEMLIPLWLSPFSFWPEPWLHHLPISQIQSAWSEPALAFIAYLKEEWSRWFSLNIFFRHSTHTLLFSFLSIFLKTIQSFLLCPHSSLQILYMLNYYSLLCSDAYVSPSLRVMQSKFPLFILGHPSFVILCHTQKRELSGKNCPLLQTGFDLDLLTIWLVSYFDERHDLEEGE